MQVFHIIFFTYFIISSFILSIHLKLADLLFLQESKSLDNNKLPNACICQEIHLP